MRAIIQILFLISVCTKIFAQINLIPDPSFEDTIKCSSKENITRFQWWYWAWDKSDSLLSVDTCARHVNNYFPGNPSAHTGNKFNWIVTYQGYNVTQAGLGLSTFTPLAKTLLAGKPYYLEMYWRLEDDSASIASDYATNNQSASFSNHCFCAPGDFVNGYGSGGRVHVQNSGNVIKSAWTKVAGCFNAVGDEKFVTLGNFLPNSQTKLEKLNNNDYKLAYYRVDDVSLYELDFNFPKDTSICAGDSVFINIGFDKINASYQWSDGVTNPIRYLKKEGIYKLIIQLDGDCKPVEKQIELKFFPTRADWNMRDTQYCIGDKFVLRAVKDSVGTKLLWSDDSTNPEITISKSGLYWVRLKNNCIVHTDSINVKALDCSVKAYIPNAFSPNGDGSNDFFLPYIYALQPIVSYKFDVFDKWGNHVYSTENISDKWDGKFRDHDCNAGVYIWQLQFKVNQAGVEVPFEYSGDVTIIK